MIGADVARCVGVREGAGLGAVWRDGCENCMRRLALLPGTAQPGANVWHISPPKARDGACPERICA